MNGKIKFYDFSDWLSWVADFLISKLYLLVSLDYKKKKGVLKKLVDHNFDFKKVGNNTFDLLGKVANQERVFRCRIFESDFMVLEQIIFEQEYLALVDLIKKDNYKPKVLFDCGANVGYTSLYLASYFNFQKIIAVEPNSETFEILSYNLKHLNSGSSVVLEKKGVWSTTTFLSVNKEFRDGRAWSYSLQEDKEKGAIPVVSLDDLIDQNNIDKIDIMKIDIEGSEANIFKDEINIKKVLAKTKYIAIEIHDEFNCREQIERMLAECGFICFKSGELTIGSNSNL